MTAFRIVCIAPVVLVALTITVLSHMPAPPGPDLGFALQDKVLHAIGYTGFGWALGLALRARTPALPKRRMVWIILIGTALFGAADELHQSFVPNRQAGVDDWIADCVGGLLSLLLLPVSARTAAFFQRFFSHAG